MKSFLRWIAVAASSAFLIAGCHKKEAPVAEVVRDAEAKLPASEQAAPVETKSVASAMPGGDQAAYEAWFKKYHLNLNDPKMLDEDPDGDGFSNREEFLADTDPRDPNSRPGIHKSIRLKEYNEVRLPLILEAVEGDKARIKRTDQGESHAEMIKAGDVVRGLPLKVVSVESRLETGKDGLPADLSKVTLEDSSTKEKLTLVKDMPAKTSASYATLVSPDGKTTLKVHQGDVFTWPAEQGATYKVVDMSQDQVVLQQIENKKVWTIPRM